MIKDYADLLKDLAKNEWSSAVGVEVGVGAAVTPGAIIYDLVRTTKDHITKVTEINRTIWGLVSRLDQDGISEVEVTIFEAGPVISLGIPEMLEIVKGTKKMHMAKIEAALGVISTIENFIPIDKILEDVR